METETRDWDSRAAWIVLDTCPKKKKPSDICVIFKSLLIYKTAYIKFLLILLFKKIFVLSLPSFLSSIATAILPWSNPSALSGEGTLKFRGYVDYGESPGWKDQWERLPQLGFSLGAVSPCDRQSVIFMILPPSSHLSLIWCNFWKWPSCPFGSLQRDHLSGLLLLHFTEYLF